MGSLTVREPHPQEAENNFGAAVAALYKKELRYKGIQALRCLGPDQLPRCIAFLGLSVLAAYKMHHDDDHSSNAYYVRLAELLRCEQVNELPVGFEPKEYAALWRFLAEWLSRERNVNLAISKRTFGPWYIVSLPLAHAPLRQVDLAKLPDFFQQYGYEPRMRASRKKLESDLNRWARGASKLTNAGRAAIEGDRWPAVLNQVAQELESWDGIFTDAQGCSFASVEIQLDVIQRRPSLFYLPRCPHSFPAVFDDGVHKFESFGEGWYDPIKIPSEDGPALFQGFAWQVLHNGIRVTLRRSPARAIPLTSSPEFSGFISHHSLSMGVRSAVLCHESIAAEAAAYLSAVCGSRCEPVSYSYMPVGWKLFLDVKPIHPLPAPAGLESISVESVAGITFVGGLRLSRRRWIAGAPPRALISGVNTGGQRPTIDGKAVNVDDGGAIQDEGILGLPGTHVITIGRTRASIEIIEPNILPPQADRQNINDAVRSNGILVILPPGCWTLLGADHHQVMTIKRLSGPGIVLNCPFEAAWAINSGGKIAVCLQQESRAAKPSLLLSGAGRQLAERWSRAILSINTKSSEISSVVRDSGSQVREAWKSFEHTARLIAVRLRLDRRRER